MTPIPDVPPETAARCQLVRGFHIENEVLATEKVMVAAPDAQWMEHQPLRDSQLWEQFAKRDASRTLIKNLCQRHGFLLSRRLYPGVDLSWTPDEFEELTPHERDDDENAERAYLDDGGLWMYRPDVEKYVLKIDRDDSDYFVETHGFWRYQLNALAAAKLIHHYLQPGSAERDQGPASSPDPWIWENHVYTGRPATGRALKRLPPLPWFDTDSETVIYPTLAPWLDESLELQERLIRCLNYLLHEHIPGVDMQVVKVPDVLYPQMRLTPPNLITGLWLQFSMYINSGRHTKICAVCGQPFVGRSAKGSSCSQRCTQRKYRENKKKRQASGVTTVSQPP